jgi:hypothetical protein
VDQNTDRYGRMLEIKNISNREINGIPKEEYWVQMQIQMETCDLDECDFLETRFKEYEGKNEFYQDILQEQTEKMKFEKVRGIILYFIDKETTRESVPFYLYLPPFYLDDEINETKINQMIEEKIKEFKETEEGKRKVLYETIYWYLDQFSCVLVKRNRKWFEHSLPKIVEFSKTIERERVEGFEHRASSRVKKGLLNGLSVPTY